MSDVLNMMGLAKMAVVVIGVFMVPIITRKFACDLGLPAGQMAMNRAAVAATGLGVGVAQAAVAGGQSGISHAIGTSATVAGKSLKKYGNQLSLDGNHPESFIPRTSLNKVSSQALEKFGGLLENLGHRHQAKKAGVPPPSLKDRLLKTVSVDPAVTGPLHEKEQRYQNFLRSQSSGESISKNGSRSLNNGTQSYSEASSVAPLQTSMNLNRSLEKGVSEKNITAGVLQKNLNLQTNPTSNQGKSVSAQSNERQWLQNEVHKSSHRWLNTSKMDRLFHSKDRKESK
jgi:hypothetical protein